MSQIMAVLAELDRNVIAGRVRVGVKAAQGQVVKFGRKPRLTPAQITHARKLLDKGENRPTVADLLCVERSTLYRALRDAACGRGHQRVTLCPGYRVTRIGHAAVL